MRKENGMPALYGALRLRAAQGIANTEYAIAMAVVLVVGTIGLTNISTNFTGSWTNWQDCVTSNQNCSGQSNYAVDIQITETNATEGTTCTNCPTDRPNFVLSSPNMPNNSQANNSFANNAMANMKNNNGGSSDNRPVSSIPTGNSVPSLSGGGNNNNGGSGSNNNGDIAGNSQPVETAGTNAVENRPVATGTKVNPTFDPTPAPPSGGGKGGTEVTGVPAAPEKDNGGRTDSPANNNPAPAVKPVVVTPAPAPAPKPVVSIAPAPPQKEDGKNPLPPIPMPPVSIKAL